MHLLNDYDNDLGLVLDALLTGDHHFHCNSCLWLGEECVIILEENIIYFQNHHLIWILYGFLLYFLTAATC